MLLQNPLSDTVLANRSGTLIAQFSKWEVETQVFLFFYFPPKYLNH